MKALAKVRQIAIFGMIGLTNTLAYFVLANVLHSFAGVDQAAVSYGAYIILVPVSFLAHRRLTFASKGRASVEWIKFCFVQAGNLLIISCVTIVARYTEAPAWSSFAAISILIPALNFVMLQLWVFTRRSAS